MWRQVIVPLCIVTLLLVMYVVFAMVNFAAGNTSYLKDDLFQFCLISLVFVALFYWFVGIIKSIVIFHLRKSLK
ncbi:hypothetical protein HPO_16715 [Hyphomonas polymorpha PS728]|uniref:Uncharacterized protein n=1 Tax=Hyphomonas polymorpha PS728 TaxID=1280954 RepID=A0A062V566_9PROT|nr:hypothetical protein HPO_16715 [Hyphomonas polymorpha PS728]